jgi:DNA-binding transcriptional LysR family regulator
MQAMRDFDLSDLDVFIAVCETGSMTEGARRMGLTESAVSHLVRRMEKRLGIALFDRKVRPLKPTILGNQLFAQGQQLLQSATGISHELKAKGHIQHAHLGIGVIETLGTWFATGLIGELAANSRSWLVASGNNAQLWERFLAHELSALVVLEDDERREGVVMSRLLTESVVLITPPQLAHMPLADLAAGIPLVGAHKESSFGRLAASHLSRLRIEVSPTATFANLDSVLMMVAQGFGWALVPSLVMLRETPERNQVAIRPLERPSVSRRITLITRPYELGGLKDLIDLSAQRVLRTQIDRTRIDHPELYGKLRFGFRGEGIGAH